MTNDLPAPCFDRCGRTADRRCGARISSADPAIASLNPVQRYRPETAAIRSVAPDPSDRTSGAEVFEASGVLRYSRLRGTTIPAALQRKPAESMQPGTFELCRLIAALVAEILVVLLGVIASNGAVRDVLAIVAQLPARTSEYDETNEMTSRRKARGEFLFLVACRSLPGIALMAAGSFMLYRTLGPLVP